MRSRKKLDLCLRHQCRIKMIENREEQSKDKMDAADA